MNRIFKSVSLVVVFVMTILLMCSCTDHPSQSGSVKDTYYIKVGDTELTKEYIGYFFYVAQLNMIKEAGMVLGEGGNSTQDDIDTFWATTEIDGKTAVDAARDLAADNAVMQTVQYLKAVDEGITLSKDEQSRIARQIADTIESNGGKEAFDKTLADMGCDAEAYEQILTENKYVEKLYTLYDESGKLSVSDEELSSYTQNHSDEVSPELILDYAKKDKFNSMVQQWEKDYEILISTDKMKEMKIKKD